MVMERLSTHFHRAPVRSVERSTERSRRSLTAKPGAPSGVRAIRVLCLHRAAGALAVEGFCSAFL